VNWDRRTWKRASIESPRVVDDTAGTAAHHRGLEGGSVNSWLCGVDGPRASRPHGVRSCHAVRDLTPSASVRPLRLAALGTSPGLLRSPGEELDQLAVNVRATSIARTNIPRLRSQAGRNSSPESHGDSGEMARERSERDGGGVRTREANDGANNTFRHTSTHVTAAARPPRSPRSRRPRRAAARRRRPRASGSASPRASTRQERIAGRGRR
jgi:hypothetical protein